MAELKLDQAAGLRSLGARRAAKVVAITGGKGGVGKTLTAVNLGTALARLGRRTMLLDADLGLANVDVLLGLYETWKGILPKNLQESYHDALQGKEEAESLFKFGYLTLRQRAQAERLFWHCCEKIMANTGRLRRGRHHHVHPAGPDPVAGVRRRCGADAQGRRHVDVCPWV